MQVCGTAAAPRYRLQRIISTREESHKTNASPNSLSELEQYADGTTAQILALQVREAYLCQNLLLTEPQE